MVLRTLLRSLDDSFSHLVFMIKERPDFRTLVPVDIIERLKTHEMEEEEKLDVNGSRRRTRALKAKASHHSSSEADSVSCGDADDPDSVAKDLALIMKRLNHFQRKKSSSPKNTHSTRHSSNSSHHRSLVQNRPLVQSIRPGRLTNWD